MASPFAVFRRNRKAMMVALTVMVMFGFVFIPMLMDAMGSRQGADPVIVSTARYGNLTQSQINQLVHRHARLVAFVRELGSAVMQAQGRGEEANKLLFHLRADESNPVPDVVRLWSLARYAQEIGMSVDNSAINDYLVVLTEKRVKPFVLDDILKRHSMRESELFELLREAMLSMGLVDTIVPSVGITTPGQRWDYFQRIRRQAKVELVPIPVKNYVGQVAEPNEAELKQFFEEHRKQPWPPSSPTPGFFQPAKVRLRYIKADVEEIAEKQITDAEVLAQYEQDKERYDRQNRPRIDLNAPDEPKTPNASPSDATEGAEREKPAPTPSTDSGMNPPSAGGSGATAPGDNTSPPSNQPKDASSSERENPAMDKPASAPAAGAGDLPAKDGVEPKSGGNEGQKGKDESSTDTSGSPDAKSSSNPPTDGASLSRMPAARFVSLADEPAPSSSEKTATATDNTSEAGDQPAKKPAGDSSAEPKSDNGVKMPEDSGSEPSKEPSPEGSKPDATPSNGKGESKVDDQPKTAPGGAASNGTDQPAEPKTSVPEIKTPPTGPTDEIKQQIRRELATRKIDELFQQVIRRLTQYREQKITGQGKVDPPDFAGWAKENRLIQIETDLLPEWDLRKLELADALAESGGTFFDTVFGQRLYVPTRGFDLRGSQFIWWPVEESKPRTPKWEEEGVRQTVLDAWKLVKARDIAKQAAEKLLAEARKSGKPLKEVFAGRADVEVLDPPEFTWMTAGSVAPLLSAGRLEVSAVGGVEWPGNEFMRTTFDLSPGETAVAMNQPRTVVYLIRVVDFTPSDNVLWESFTTLEYRHYAQIAANDMQAKLFGWFAQIQDAIGLKWDRDYQDSPQE